MSIERALTIAILVLLVLLLLGVIADGVHIDLGR